jgi:hypothetical protein
VLAYLSAETSFLRAYGNRSLLLIVLCVLTRSGDSIAKASALGVTLDINPAVIAAFGPVLALVLLISLKVEADTLVLAREAVLEEASALNRRATPYGWLYLLFGVPAAAAAFMALQFILKLVPSGAGCNDWSLIKQLLDFSYQGGAPSIYCIGDLAHGTPWIYPPLQTYLYIACVGGCAYLTYCIARDWPKLRGASG